MKQCNFG